MTGQERTEHLSHRRRVMPNLISLIKNDITISLPSRGTGNVYHAQVQSVTGNCLAVNLPRRVAGQGFLRTSAPVIVSFIVGNILYEVPGEYHAEYARVCQIVITGEIKETTRRRFSRMPLEVKIGYVPVSDLSIKTGRLNNVGWKQGSACDISGGGILIQTQLPAPIGSYLLLNLEIESFQGSLLVFGQVRWSRTSEADSSLYQCGIMFITREDLPAHFSRQSLSVLSPIMMQFDERKQRQLDAFLTALSQE